MDHEADAQPFGDGLAGGDINFHNAVHSYYNNQSVKRIIEDLEAENYSYKDLKVVELSIDGASPVLALVTPYRAEKGTTDAIRLTAVTKK